VHAWQVPEREHIGVVAFFVEQSRSNVQGWQVPDMHIGLLGFPSHCVEETQALHAPVAILHTAVTYLVISNNSSNK